MSYDINLVDAVTGDVLQLDEPHHMRGGTYAAGGTSEASLNVTYNYAEHFERVLPTNTISNEVGIRSIYGMTGVQSLRVLSAAILLLGDDADPDYWKPTEGNAKRALIQLVILASMRLDGVWKGD